MAQRGAPRASRAGVEGGAALGSREAVRVHRGFRSHRCVQLVTCLWWGQALGPGSEPGGQSAEDSGKLPGPGHRPGSRSRDVLAVEGASHEAQVRAPRRLPFDKYF